MNRGTFLRLLPAVLVAPAVLQRKPRDAEWVQRELDSGREVVVANQRMTWDRTVTIRDGHRLRFTNNMVIGKQPDGHPMLDIQGGEYHIHNSAFLQDRLG